MNWPRNFRRGAGLFCAALLLAAAARQLPAAETNVPIQTLTYESSGNSGATVQLAGHRHYYGGYRGGYYGMRSYGYAFGYGAPYYGGWAGYGPQFYGGYNYYAPRYWGYSYYRPRYWGSYYGPSYYDYTPGYYSGYGYGGYSYAAPSYYVAPPAPYYYGSWGFGSACCD